MLGVGNGNEDDMPASSEAAGLTYQVDEAAPWPVLVGVGLQYALLSIATIMLKPAVAFGAAGMSESLVLWAVFASVVIGGTVMVLHARPVGRFGAGYVLAASPITAALAITADALVAGGPALLAALVLTGAVVQLGFALRMSLLRRLLTPAVSGTVLMLIPVTVMPIVFGLYERIPPGHPPSAAPVCTGVTALVIGAVVLKGTPGLRPWGLLIGLAVGAAVGAWYGLYDAERVAEAAWLGLPTGAPAHFDSAVESFDFAAYLGLAPAFVLLFLVFTIRSMGNALAVQTVSWRRRRAMDFRPVQGTIAADALSNLAAALAGTMPNSTGSGTVARTQLTGVATRRVGVVFGCAVILLAFCPKVAALILAVPEQVFAGYLTVAQATAFVIGLKMAVSEGADHRQSVIIGVSFWSGVGCQYGFIFPDFLATFLGGMFANALTTGGLLAIGLTALLVFTGPRRLRLETELALSALPQLRDFARQSAKRCGCTAAGAERLEAVAEETLHTLLGDEQEADAPRRLLVMCYREGSGAALEFIAAGGTENVEDRLAVLGETATQESALREVSLRLLRHMAAEVRHRQYHDVDVVMVRVEDQGAG